MLAELTANAVADSLARRETRSLAEVERAGSMGVAGERVDP